MKNQKPLKDLFSSYYKHLQTFSLGRYKMFLLEKSLSEKFFDGLLDEKSTKIFPS